MIASVRSTKSVFVYFLSRAGIISAGLLLDPTVFPTATPTTEPTTEPTIEPTVSIIHSTVEPTSRAPTLEPSFPSTPSITDFPFATPTVSTTASPTILTNSSYVPDVPTAHPPSNYPTVPPPSNRPPITVNPTVADASLGSSVSGSSTLLPVVS